MKILTLALIFTLAGFSQAPAFAGERQINIAAKNFAFVPSTITLKLHQRAKLRFMATQGAHGIVIPDIGVNAPINIGRAATAVEVTPKKLGTFTARCTVFCGVGHANMILTVKVIK
ncbi:MAG: cupredoxin domain-containing protein [Candidatus Eremiobacteraeota bacterium]|nr:cupredoxin domain-containing protein [Candidatus Eremiobacteraeota bacterium]